MILQRHILSSFLASLGFSLCAFTFLLALAETFHLLGLQSDQDIIYVYYYLFYSLPRFAAQVLPIALLFGSCFSITQLNLRSELIAMYAAGLSLWRLILGPLLTSLALAVLYLAASETFLLQYSQTANSYKNAFLAGTYRQSKTFTRAQNLRGKEGFYYINYMPPESMSIKDGFSYLQMDDKQEPVHFYEADSAEYLPERKLWLLRDARIAYFDDNIRVTRTERKSTYLLALAEKPDFFRKRPRLPNELTMRELHKEINKKRRQGADPNEYIIELHSRLSFPLTCLFLCLIGAFGGASGRLRSGNSLSRSLFLCTIVILIYYLGFSLTNSLAKVALLHPALAPWLPLLLYAALSFLVWKGRSLL